LCFAAHSSNRRTATLLVLTTVVQIFENFRYHPTFSAGSHDAALEFAANIANGSPRASISSNSTKPAK
jgi:hypothetical protein